jgi:hypothetical protein
MKRLRGHKLPQSAARRTCLWWLLRHWTRATVSWIIYTKVFDLSSLETGVLLIVYEWLAVYWGESQKSWWFAATDHCNEANWYWCFGNSKVRFFDKSFNPFGSGSADNYQNVENCATINEFDPMRVNDITCTSYQTNYICEVHVTCTWHFNVYQFFLWPGTHRLATTVAAMSDHLHRWSKSR